MKEIARIWQEGSKAELQEYVISQTYNDVELFGDIFLAHWKVFRDEYIECADFHREIYAVLWGKENANIVCPRWHAKTTTVLIFIMHALLMKKNKYIIYVASSGLWEEWVGKIKEEMETNVYIMEIFGAQVLDGKEKKMMSIEDMGMKKWRSKRIELANGGRLATMTKGMAIRWQRPDLVILDDPQEDSDVRNKDIVERFNRWVFTSLYNTLLPWGKMIALGTIVGNNCLVNILGSKYGFKEVRYKAVEDWVALRPAVWSLEALEERKKVIGTANFNQEFMHIAILSESQIIKREWIRYYREQDLPQAFDKIVLAVDPAISQKDSADYIGLVIMGYKWEYRFVLHSEQCKMSMNALQAYVSELHKKWSFNVILVESVAFQAMVRQLFASAGLPVRAVVPHKDKATRLMQVSWKIEFWKFFVRVKGDEELVYQMTNFPDVANDDILDACIYTLEEWNLTDYKTLMEAGRK